MDDPSPLNSSGQPDLTLAIGRAGTGRPIRPRLTEVEVLYTAREWHPATVLGWYCLDIAHEQLRTGLLVIWFVHLRVESGEDLWFEYVKLNIRPR
jgi:hypothetical protein